MNGDRDTLPVPPDLRGTERHAVDTRALLKAPAEAPRVSEHLAFVVGHSDTTVHLHETLFGARGDSRKRGLHQPAKQGSTS